MNPAPASYRFQVQSLVLRIGLLSTGLVLFARAYDLWIYGQSWQSSLSLLPSFAAWGFGACLAILALHRPSAALESSKGPSSRSAWLILIGLLGAFLSQAYLHWHTYQPLTAPHTDNQMIAEYAVQVLRRGINPYTWDFTDFRRAYHDLLDFTAFLDGSIQRRLTYPALPTLLLTALETIGLGYVKLISVAAHASVLILLFVGSPPTLRPVILLPLFVFREFAFFPLAGLQDVLWCALILGMVISWNRPVWRAVFFGLACSYRQQPWLIAPFLLIELWHEGGPLRERMLRLGDFALIATAVFLVTNLPFMIWDPVAWLLGAMEPSYASFNVWSQGLGALTQFGLIPWPRTFYTVLQLSIYASALLLYWRHPRTVRHAIWVFPAFFFWLYYRALANYWIYWIPPLLLVVARSYEPGSALERVSVQRGASWKITSVILGIAMVLPLMVAVGFLVRQDPVSAAYHLPIQTSNILDRQVVTRVEVEVTNHSPEILEPRFSVQREQPYPWSIESGPEMLEPGRTGTYIIRAGYPAVAFPLSEGAQIVVTDAGGDYALREELLIPPDPTFRDPDRIVNPQYRFWAGTPQLPVGWQAHALRPGSGTVRMERVDGRDALVLQPGAPESQRELRLGQQITFPEAFDIWVYRTSSLSAPKQGIGYGLEIFDGLHRLWVLFGDSEESGFLDNHAAYVSMLAPLDAWSLQHIALGEIYERLGWPLPPATLRVQNDLDFQARQVMLSLLLMSDGSSSRTGIFGPFEQPAVQRVGSTDYLERALHDPSAYYVGLGNKYNAQRNYQLALDAYGTALDYQPDNAEAFYGQAMAYFGLQERERATDSLEESLKHGHPQPERLIAGAFFDMAEALFWEGDWQAAVAGYSRAIDLGYPRSFLAHKGLGWAYLNLGALEDARRSFERAVDAVPDPVEDAVHLADALAGLGWVTVEEKGCDEALRLFQRALLLAPDLSSAREGLRVCEGAE